MSEPKYITDTPDKFSKEQLEVFKALLIKQDKVKDVTVEKIKRCHTICICTVDDVAVSIGALKPKTKSDFTPQKANLPDLEKQFEFELGYLFTEPSEEGNGYGRGVTQRLLNAAGEVNLMASTEMRDDNRAKKMLLLNGFEKHGATWKSGIHGGDLGLFLRFAK